MNKKTVINTQTPAVTTTASIVGSETPAAKLGAAPNTTAIRHTNVIKTTVRAIGLAAVLALAGCEGGDSKDEGNQKDNPAPTTPTSTQPNPHAVPKTPPTEPRGTLVKAATILMMRGMSAEIS